MMYFAFKILLTVAVLTQGAFASCGTTYVSADKIFVCLNSGVAACPANIKSNGCTYSLASVGGGQASAFTFYCNSLAEMTQARNKYTTQPGYTCTNIQNAPSDFKPCPASLAKVQLCGQQLN